MNINKSIFKEYDIRGRYPEDISDEFAYNFGKAYGSYLQTKYNKNTCVVSCDNRLSSPNLHKYLIKGLLETGINVFDYGMITTPMHYLARYTEKCPGIQITASHNPKDDNGFKFSYDGIANTYGKKISDLADFMVKGDFLKGKGNIIIKSITNNYLSYLSKNTEMGTRPLQIVVDPGNGVTTSICKEAFSLFPNLNVTYICDISDGSFPNHHPDPVVESNMEMLKQKVLEMQADLGIAFDGDGDRVGFIDNLGNLVPADIFSYIVVKYLLPTFNNKTILFDIKCTKALEDEIRKEGGNPLPYRTGASFTHSKVLTDKLCYGAEYSGHIFFQDRDIAIGCGIYAGLRMCEILSKTTKMMNELSLDINKYYQTPEIKIEMDNIQKFAIVNKVLDYVKEKKYHYIDIDGVKVIFSYGFALVRASNTGPDLTLRFEAKNLEQLQDLRDEFESLVNTQIKNQNK